MSGFGRAARLGLSATRAATLALGFGFGLVLAAAFAGAGLTRIFGLVFEVGLPRFAVAIGVLHLSGRARFAAGASRSR
jgi:hypothetical protein